MSLVPRWRSEITLRGLTAPFHAEERSAPAVSADGASLFIGSSDGRVRRLRERDGTQVWSVDLQGGAIFSPVQPSGDGTLLLVATMEGHVVCLDAVDGAENWRYQGDSGVVSAPLVAKGMVGFVDERAVLTMLSLEDGGLRWQYRRPLPDSFRVFGAPRPVLVIDRRTEDGDSEVAPGTAAVLAGFPDGSLVALDGETGDERWVVSLGGGRGTNAVFARRRERGYMADVFAPLQVSAEDNLVYAASFADGVAAISLDGGQVAWRVEVAGVTGLAMQDPPAALGAGPVLVVSTSRGELLVVDRDTGRQLAGHRLQQGALQGVEGLHDERYVLSYGQEAGALLVRLKDGAILGVVQPGRGVLARPVVYRDRLLLYSNGGVLYSFLLAAR